MNLVIHTTTWWGNHPSMAYYSNAKTSFDYSINEFENTIKTLHTKSCFAAEKEDWNIKWGLLIVSENERFILGTK